MKPKYLVFDYKTVVITLLTVLASSMFFVACKKDNSIVNPESTSQTASNQVVNSGEETISSRATNTAPKARAGNDQTITLPTTSATFDGNSSYDDDGSITSYQWTKEIGPAATIAAPTSAQTAITGLTAGSYRLRLTVTDDDGATGTDTVHLTVTGTGGGTTNQAPIVNAGVDKTITSPTSNVLIVGTASDPDGTIASYLWSKVSGTGGTIASSNSAATNITGLTAGSYVFSLTVTDNQGATAIDNVTVTVNGGTSNTPPTVNAGTDKTITLPTNSVSLTGTASDPNGSVASYLWAKVSGSGGSISSPNSATTNITGLTAGSYVFSLKATDNQGATATDNVTVTVNSATNTPPTVNAGTDKTITLPTNSVSLTGTASDPNGSIASYLWTKVSGSGGTIASATAATTNITGLTAGSYVFSLKATDNQGATATDNVTVTVNAATQTVGTLVYSNGYNVSSDISSNQLGRGGLSTSLFKTGPGSFRSEVRAGDAPISSGWRSEQQYGSNETPKEGIYEYDVYYENWGGFDGGGHSVQWHPYTSGASANISLQNYSGKFDVVRCIGSTVTHQSGTLKTCASNTWYHIKWEVRFSTGSDGYIRLFVDGTQTYSYTGVTDDDGSGQYFKLGQNRWPSGSGTSMTTTSVCYYDNLKIYRIN